MKWQNLFYALFAVALITGTSFWFLKNFELKQVDEFTGYKGEARTNTLFAARLFLKRMGIPTERSDGLPNLPDTDTVILLNTERYSLSPEKTAELLDWVRRGGHLITRARVDTETQEELDAAENKRFTTENRDALQTHLGITIGAHQMPDDSELPVLFQPENSTETLSVELDFFNALSTNDEYAIQYQLDEHAWFIDQPYGDGYISLLTTLDFFENHSLDKADHSKLLWYLLHSHKPELQQVWLVHQDTLPSLLTLLVRHASPLLFAFALLLFFIFWALIPRFGAMIPQPPPQRRRILDHIKASGQFFWKRQNKGKEQLSQTMQQRVKTLAQQHIPGWQLLPEAQQYSALTDYLQSTDLVNNSSKNKQYKKQSANNDLESNHLNSENLQHLLTANTLDEQNFTRLVQLAQRIRKLK